MASRRTTRVQIELSPEAMKALRNLKAYYEASSYAEVIRRLLQGPFHPRKLK